MFRKCTPNWKALSPSSLVEICVKSVTISIVIGIECHVLYTAGEYTSAYQRLCSMESGVMSYAGLLPVLKSVLYLSMY